MTVNKSKINISLDLRIISLILLVTIVAMLAAWRPWSMAATNSTRTITVNGEATIDAVPDEYVFMPSYEFKDVNKDTALAALSAKSDTVLKELKNLGVASSKIKANSDGYNYPEYFLDKDTGQNTYTLRLTVKVSGQKLVQKVQDYLVTTTPLGQISPQANFSDTARKTLEDKARDEATKNAREKAERSAANLGFKIVRIKSIEDGNSYGGVTPLMSTMAVAEDSATSRSSLIVQPGENELNYSVKVVYFIR